MRKIVGNRVIIYMNPPITEVKGCVLTQDFTGTYFLDPSRNERYAIVSGVRIEYQRQPIDLNQLDVNTVATLRLLPNKSVYQVSITFLCRSTSQILVYQEGVIVFSERKFPTEILQKLETDAESKIAAEVINHKCPGIRKVSSQGGTGFLTALGLAYLEHLALNNVDRSEFVYFAEMVTHAGGQEMDSFILFLQDLWRHKTSENGSEYLDSFHSDGSFRANLVKVIKALIIAYAKAHSDSDQLSFLENGVPGLEADVNYSQEISQSAIAVAALALPIRLVIYRLDPENLRSAFEYEKTHPSLANVYLLQQFEMYHILYSQEHIDVEGYNFELGRRENAQVGAIRSLYYTPRVKETLPSADSQENLVKKTDDLKTQANIALQLQRVINSAFVTLNSRDIGGRQRLFDDTLLVQTYETSAEYKRLLGQINAKRIANEFDDLTALRQSQVFDDFKVMKACSKCEGTVECAVLECKHYLCVGCFRSYVSQFPSILKPSGDPVDAFICPVISCNEKTKPISKEVIAWFLGSEMDQFLQIAEEATGTKKCQICAIICPANLFFLLPYCGCKICVYCQINLMKTNNWICMCGNYIHRGASQAVSTIQQRCFSCGNIRNLSQDFTPVKCEDHIFCTKCLEKVMKAPESKCPYCSRVFSPFEIEVAKPFFFKQCFLFCERVFSLSEALDLPCGCHYCKQCAEWAVLNNGSDITRCFSCRNYFPDDLMHQLERMLRQHEFMQKTIKEAQTATLARIRVQAVQCGICLSYIGVEQNFQLNCGHQFHRNCIGKYGENIASGMVQEEIRCPDPNCRQFISADQLSVAMNPTEFIKYTEKLVPLGINLLECPNCRTQSQYEPMNARAHVACQICRYHFCGVCKKQWSNAHDFKECKYEEMQARIHMLEEASRNKPSDILAQCPGCKTPYSKDEGCEHMKCLNPQCQLDWCFFCSAPRAPIIAHHNSWHRPNCKFYVPMPDDPEPMKPNCPECVKLGRRCDPPKQLKVPRRFDVDEE